MKYFVGIGMGLFWEHDLDAEASDREMTFWRSTAGTTAIEYGLIVGGIALAILAIVFQVGENLEVFFNFITNEVVNRTARVQ